MQGIFFLKLVGNVASYIERQNTFFIQSKTISHRFDAGLAKGSVPSVCTYFNFIIEQITSEDCLVEESAHVSLESTYVYAEVYVLYM